MSNWLIAYIVFRWIVRIAAITCLLAGLYLMARDGWTKRLCKKSFK